MYGPDLIKITLFHFEMPYRMQVRDNKLQFVKFAVPTDDLATILESFDAYNKRTLLPAIIILQSYNIIFITWVWFIGMLPDLSNNTPIIQTDQTMTFPLFKFYNVPNL